MARGEQKSHKETRKPKKDTKKAATGPAPIKLPTAEVPAIRIKEKKR